MTYIANALTWIEEGAAAAGITPALVRSVVVQLVADLIAGKPKEQILQDVIQLFTTVQAPAA